MFRAKSLRHSPLRALASQNPSILDTLKSIILPPGTRPVSPVPNFPAESLLPSAQTIVTKLSNGLRVATEKSAGDIATVGVWIDTGSRYETEATNGTAHFLEHMAFKGTKTRSQFEIERQIENMGAHLNAYTSREHTVYFAKVQKNDVKFATGFIADLLQNSVISPDAIERERDVILREMEEVDLQHSELVFDKLHQMAFRGTSLGRTIIGPQNNVVSLNRDHLSNFVKTHYTADRMVIVGSGAVDHGKLCEWASEAYSGLPSTTPENLKIVNGGKPFFIGSDVRMREDEMEQTHMALAFEGLPWVHPDALVLPVMVALLGVYDKAETAGARESAGKLSRIIAAEGLADTVMPFNTPYADTGLFGVYCIAGPEKLSELCWQVQEEITRLCYEVDEDDVRRSINQVKANIVHNLDGSQAVFEDIGRQLLTLGRRLSLNEIFQRLDAISAKDITRVANALFYDRDLAMSAIGPTVGIPDYLKLRRRTYWLRY